MVKFCLEDKKILQGEFFEATHKRRFLGFLSWGFGGTAFYRKT
jgi:hypothetical protein